MKQGFNDARPPFDQNFEPRKMGPGSQFEPPRQPFDHSRHQGFDGGRFEGPLRPPYPKNFPGGFQQFPMGRDENAPQNPTNPFVYFFSINHKLTIEFITYKCNL